MNEKNSREQNVFEIDLLKLAAAYLRKWWLIVILTLVGMGIMYVLTTFYVTPTYRASTTIYVNSPRSKEKSEYISSGDLAFAERLVSTYTSMLTSDTVLSKVIESTGYSYTTDQLRKMTSSEQVKDTEIFKVYVTDADPKAAAALANAIAYTAPEVISDFVEGSSTKIIDYAKVPTIPSSPNPKKNIAIGGIVGVVLALAFLTVAFLLDVRIKGEQDLSELCDVPVLGQIPDFSQLELKRSSSKMNDYEYGGPENTEQKEKGGVTDGKKQ